jgi:hypothetical protein
MVVYFDGVDSIEKHLGHFEAMEEARKAYVDAAHKYFGEFMKEG